MARHRVDKKKYGNHLEDVNYVRSLFVNELNQSTQKKILEDEIDWKMFELYENIRSRYLRNLIVSPMMSQNNDYNDLQNMIYVQNEDKYWTLEKRWLNIARETKMDKYLFTPHSYIAWELLGS